MLAAALPGLAAAAEPLEPSVKAAFLAKFPRYVEWPGAARGRPVVLCVVGADPFGRLLDTAAAGEQGGHRPLEVRRIGASGDAEGCDVAFLRGANGRGNAALLAQTAGRPILTVTDARDGPQRGIIHFELRGGRVGFHVDNAAAMRAKLMISSRLLQIALSVRQTR